MTIKGRGTSNNPQNRFQLITTDREDQYQPDKLATIAMPLSSRTIISRNKSPDIPFNLSINPYQGCEHGCIYCFARPTHAYWDLSPGLDFETRLFYKPNAAQLLANQFEKSNYVCEEAICIGANTDPYQPLERKKNITRQILEVMLAYKHPVTIVTKGALIERDMDLLKELAELNLVKVAISVTTLDNQLKTRLEPRAASHSTRLEIIRQLTNHKIPVTCLVAPIIPFINDQEIESIIASAASAGAISAGYILLRLPLEVKELFEQWLQDHYPDRSKRVINTLKDCHEGKSYRSEFGLRMTGTGVYASIFKQRFQLACRYHGIPMRESRKLRTDLFLQKKTQNQQQIELF